VKTGILVPAQAGIFDPRWSLPSNALIERGDDGKSGFVAAVLKVKGNQRIEICVTLVIAVFCNNNAFEERAQIK